ncbi:MAG TPA: YaaC family protein [Longimicrobiaceae bacterium]|nr:YaaC family protein [Longimicrobiaceae bacterium]
MEQAEALFHSGVDATLPAAKPLLLYYAFLNLTKAYSLTEKHERTLSNARHGLSEQQPAGSTGLTGAWLDAYASKPGQVPNAFAEHLKSFGGFTLPAAKTAYTIADLLPQVVPGHRLWCEAAGQVERFIALDEIQPMEDRATKTIWLRFWISEQDLSRLGVTHAAFLRRAGLADAWREVNPEATAATPLRRLLFEQKAPEEYRGRAADRVLQLLRAFRPLLWATVASIPPYRRYYVYLAPNADRSRVLPQLGSIYALIYYLGSVTRYRPQEFDAIVVGSHGPQVLELLTNQPNQYLYLVASEFARREVARASIV